ncbi:hypothetical protein KC368_g64 [Hortaea werneckii]|nr:hypothetical protein KC368_g64 [Hortaea werneckii]
MVATGWAVKPTETMPYPKNSAVQCSASATPYPKAKQPAGTSKVAMINRWSLVSGWKIPAFFLLRQLA